MQVAVTLAIAMPLERYLSEGQTVKADINTRVIYEVANYGVINAL